MNNNKSGFFSLFIILSIFVLLAGCSRGPTSEEGDGGVDMGGGGPTSGAGKLTGSFEGSYNADLSMCSNSVNNGSFIGTGSITFGSNGNFTVVHTRSDGVMNMTSAIAFNSDDVAADGSITGNFTEAFRMVGATAVAWSGSGTITGTKNGDEITIDFMGTGDDSCMLMGTLVLSPATGVPPTTLSRVTVTPNNRTIASGTTLQYTAIATYSDGANVDVTSQASWSSSMSAVATINDTVPNKGFATAAVVTVTGTTAIQATFADVSGTARLTVSATAPTLTAVQVTPPTASTTVGNTQQFTATAIFSNSTSEDVTNMATWTSLQTGIAAVGNLATNKGLALGVSAPGTATVRAAFGGMLGSAALTVTNATLETIEVSPLSTSVAVSASVQFTATGVYSDGTKQDLTSQVNWTSGNVIVATVSNVLATKGLATGVLAVPNSIFITAMDPGSGLSGAGSLQVTPVQTITAITLSPAVASVPVTLTRAFTATATFADLSTGDVTNAVVWDSSNFAVAIISNDPGSNGVATGIMVGGPVDISAAHLDYPTLVIAPASLTVTAAGIASISVTPTTASITVGGTQQYEATALFTDGSSSVVTDSVTWLSSDSAIAAISNAAGEEGLATGIAANADPVDISATDSVSGVSSNLASLTVTGVASIVILPDGQTIFTGTSLQYTAMATLSNGTSLDVTSEVIWSSSDTAVAVISNALGSEGLATGQGAGTTSISAEHPSGVTITPLSLTVVPLFMEDFEDGGAGWSFVPDSVSVWDIGTVVPVAGPGPGGGGGGGMGGGAFPAACFAGTQCAGTVLDGAYPVRTAGTSVDDLLRSPEIQLAPVSAGDEIHLQFQQWVSYLTGDQGELWIRDAGEQQWTQLSPAFIVTGLVGGGAWQAIDLDLSAYAGRTIELGFDHHVTNTAGTAAGWYIDDVEFVVVSP
jgi:hypothetical protein